MKLFLVKCYNEADFPSSGTSFSELVLADSLDDAFDMVKAKTNPSHIFEEQSKELDLPAIERMRKPRILS